MEKISCHQLALMSLGDDGTSKDAVSTGKLNQENEHIYNLWCSGRVCCEGMLIQLKVCVGIQLFTVHIHITLEEYLSDVGLFHCIYI